MAAEAHKHIADAALAISAGAIFTGMTIGQVDQYLQAFAYLTGSIAAIISALYYYKRWRDDAE
jgi:hypothetical protein